MRLTKLHVEGFGKLSEIAFELETPVTIVYGPNEAGKSTLLGFIRSMLYGFANKGNRTERLEPVNGGRHGGRLFFADEGGYSYVMERYGNSTSKVSVRRIAGDTELDSDRSETLTQPEWERAFLGGVSERVFRELFAITLTELQAIGMLEGDELGKQLYHAGWNGGSAIVGAEKLLQGQLDDLFKPRGSTQQINKLVKALEETEDRLRKLEDGIASFNGLTADIEATELELVRVEERLTPLRSQTALLRRAAVIRREWLSRLVLLQELDSLKEAPRLAADARSRWEALANELRRVNEEIREADGLAEELESRSERLFYDPALLGSKTEIAGLMLSVEQISAARETVLELAAEMREHDESMKRLLLRISPDWTEASLRGFHAGVADREAVRDHRTALQEAEKALRQTEAEHRAAYERERDAASQLAALGATVQDRLASGSVGSANPEREVWASEQGGEELAEIFKLQPRTVEELRYAARQFEECWRELELARLRDKHEAGAAEAAPQSRGGGAAVLWAGSGVLAATALALAAAGMSAAAAAAGAAALALAAPALLRQAGSSRAGRAARGGRTRAAQAAPTAPAAGHVAAAEQRALAALGELVAAPSAALALLLPREHAGAGAGAGAATASAAAAAAMREAAAARAGEAGGPPTGRYAADQGRHAEPPGRQAEQPARHAVDLAAPARLLARLRAAIDARQDELRAHASSAQRRAELTSTHARLRAQEQVALAAAEAAEQAAADIAADWRDWLTARALPTSLSPEAAMETIDLAEQAQQRIQAHDRAADKAARLRDTIAAFERSVGLLSEAWPDVTQRAYGDSVSALRLLQAEVDRQTSARSEREELLEKQAEQTRRKVRLAQSLEELHEQRERWFAAGEVTDELSWLNVLQRSERLLELEQEMFKLNVQLTAGLSDAEQAQLEEWFVVMDETALHEALARTEGDLLEAEQQRNTLQEQLGRKRQRLEQLLRDGERQQLIAEREQTIAALERLIGRYAVLSVGMTMIKRTKRIMEEQRQPGVLREASKLMNRMSEGRYKRISMPEGERTIALETEDGRIVESGFLSRGTAEQLYLAMRFALADEAAAVHVMPLLLDDPFVNFDYDRLQAATEVLKELAQRRQIVFFTCHAHMRDLLLERLPNARLVSLTS